MSVRSHGVHSKVGTSHAMSVKSTFLVPTASAQEVSISSRPLTAAGGISISRKSNGVSSLLHDQKLNNPQYFAAFLSQKEKEIVNEIQRLQNDTKVMEANVVAYSAKQKTYNILLSDVTKLQETIADYNLAFENEANGCDPEELEELAIKLKERNQGLANDIDNIFVRVKCLEEEVKKKEEEKANIIKKIQRILDSSDREDNRLYRRLNAKLEEVQKFKTFMNTEISTLQENLKDIQIRLEERNDKDLLDRMDMEEEAISSCMKDLEIINEKLFVAQMSAEEAKVYLLDKVKTNKAKELKIDEECAAIQDKLQTLESKESQLFHIIFNAESPEISSCKAIWEQRKNAVDFLEESNYTVNSIQAENETMKKNIATLQEILNEKTNNRGDDKISAKSIHDKINYKSKNLDNSRWTISQLSDQKMARAEELEKVRNIKDKIHNEYEQLEVEISKMKQKMEKYDDLQTVEVESERIKAYLMQMTEQFKAHEEAFSIHVKQISDEYNKNSEYLSNSKTWNSMEKYENMIARQSQVNFELKQDLDLNRRLTDYESAKNECFKYIHELNKLLLPGVAKQ